MSNYIVGITGGIASGKSTVTNLFARKGIDIIDADVIARQVVEPGQAAFEEIISKFGDSIMLPQGTLNRAKLRELVFNNNDHKKWLNNLLHPLIREDMKADCKRSSSEYCMLALPLLFENKLEDMVNRILVVDVDEKSQLMRAIQRDASNAKTLKAIIASQVTREVRLAGADDVIDNNGQQSSLYSQIDDLHEKYLALSKNQK